MNTTLVPHGLLTGRESNLEQQHSKNRAGAMSFRRSTVDFHKSNAAMYENVSISIFLMGRMARYSIVYSSIVHKQLGSQAWVTW